MGLLSGTGRDYHRDPFAHSLLRASESFGGLGVLGLRGLGSRGSGLSKGGLGVQGLRGLVV